MNIKAYKFKLIMYPHSHHSNITKGPKATSSYLGNKVQTVTKVIHLFKMNIKL